MSHTTDDTCLCQPAGGMSLNYEAFRQGEVGRVTVRATVELPTPGYALFFRPILPPDAPAEAPPLGLELRMKRPTGPSLEVISRTSAECSIFVLPKARSVLVWDALGTHDVTIESIDEENLAD